MEIAYCDSGDSEDEPVEMNRVIVSRPTRTDNSAGATVRAVHGSGSSHVNAPFLSPAVIAGGSPTKIAAPSIQGSEVESVGTGTQPVCWDAHPAPVQISRWERGGCRPRVTSLRRLESVILTARGSQDRRWAACGTSTRRGPAQGRLVVNLHDVYVGFVLAGPGAQPPGRGLPAAAAAVRWPALIASALRTYRI